MRLMSRTRHRQRQRRRRTTRQHGSIASIYKKKCSPCRQDDNSQGGEGLRSGLNFPEDIIRHIHALMPLRDAARVACASHAFLRSWRCHPNLTLSKESLGLNETVIGKDEMTRVLISKVDHILKKHSGVGMKKLELNLIYCKKVDYGYLSNWLHIAVTAGIEELTMSLPRYSEVVYNFPCSPLFSGSENSIKYLHLSGCAFRPTAGLDCWRRLKKLSLVGVLITGSELEGLLSNCFTLEWLRLSSCSEIVCVKIPCQLQRLSFLGVGQCRKLQEIETNAPNISTFHFFGNLVKISFEGALQVKDIRMNCSCESNIFWYARTKLMPSVPNVEKLSIVSYNEVHQPDMKHDSIIGDSSHLRQLLEHRHDNLRSVMIAGFCSAKSLVELTCHIVENASSLACLTLDTTHGCYSSGDKPGICVPMGRDSVKEAQRTLLAIRTHIEGIIPSRVKLNISEPCSQCHAVD
ncbi:unnamed protein product [Alopecurus aequalis]